MSAEMPDLDAIVREWAYEMYECTKTRDQPKVGKECLDLNIIWDHVRFIHHPPEYTEEKPAAPKARVLFKTFFSNYTKGEQAYSFKTERTTQSTCELHIDKGVQTGQKYDVALQTPMAIFSAHAGFHQNIKMGVSGSETLEEEIKWEVDSQVKVQPNKRITAELTIKESKYTGKFKLKSEIYGMVMVKVTNYKDHNTTIRNVEGAISDIIIGVIKKGVKGFTVDKKVVTYETKGVCTFSFAVDQEVKLTEDSL